MAACTFAIGATILIGIEAAGASDQDLIGATCNAVLKAAVETVDGFTVPPADAPEIASFAVVSRAYSADVGPGWDLQISPDVSAGLAPGTYVTNAVLTLASGFVVKTGSLIITMTQATS